MWINCKVFGLQLVVAYGSLRRLFIIFVRRFTEPKTAVKLQFDSLIVNNNCKERAYRQLSEPEFPLRLVYECDNDYDNDSPRKRLV